MNRFLFFILTLFLLVGSQKLMAGQYTVNTGKSINIYCTADAPGGGWITHAFYELADANDAQYLALYSHSSECYATVTGISAKASVKIQVTYTYSYRGTYDGSIHVGHGTYYDYVTVKGGGVATGVRFDPSDVNMKVGETVKVKIIVTPDNTSSTTTWGVTSLSSAPSSYEIQQEGNVLSIKAKRKMSLYLMAETNNGLQGFCVIHAKDETPENAIAPTNISIMPEKLLLKEGESAKLDYMLTPTNASTAITWTSDNEEICNINSSGELTALQSGQTNIIATTSNGLKASCSVTVCGQLLRVVLPGTEKVTKGYQMKFIPEVYPEGAMAEWQWKSSDESVIYVDDNGVAVAQREGTAKITVIAKDGNSKAECVVTVCAPTKGTDIRNVNLRIQSIENIIKQSLLLMK